MNLNISQKDLLLYRGDTCAFDVLLHDDGGAPTASRRTCGRGTR